jgi:hypothetical protein
MKRLVVIAVLLSSWALPAGALAASGPDRRIVVEGPVLVDRGETTSDVYVADGDVTVRGTVDGDLAVASGDVTIRGRVTGTVVTLAGTATLGRAAIVDGDLLYADEKPQVAPGAKVGGDVKKLKADDAGTAVRIGVWVAVTVSTLVFGLLLLLLFPRAADAVARTAKARTGMTALTGVLAFILIPLVGFAVLFTVVGIPLGIGLLLAWLPLYGLAYTASAFIAGRLVVRTGTRVLAFVVGVVILRVLAIVPFLGELAWTVATVFGLGALLTSALRARRA